MNIVLTKAEKDIIDRYGLREYGICDTRGMNYREAHDYAKDKNCQFIIGTTSQCGHRLKTRSSNCIFCHPRCIKFQLRYSMSGIVYIAKSGEYSKVGVCECNTLSIEKTLYNREANLNSEGGYGGITDWSILEYCKVEKDLGCIENKIHGFLSKYRVEQPYVHGGRAYLGKELFKCSKEQAEKVAKTVLKSEGLIATFVDWKKTEESRGYWDMDELLKELLKKMKEK